MQNIVYVLVLGKEAEDRFESAGVLQGSPLIFHLVLVLNKLVKSVDNILHVVGAQPFVLESLRKFGEDKLKVCVKLRYLAHEERVQRLNPLTLLHSFELLRRLDALEQLHYLEGVEEAAFDLLLYTAFFIDFLYHILESESIILLDLNHFVPFEADVLLVLASSHVNYIIIIKLCVDHSVFCYADDQVLLGIFEHVLELLNYGRDDVVVLSDEASSLSQHKYLG